MYIQFRVIARANSRKTQYAKKDTLRAFDELGLSVVPEDRYTLLRARKEVADKEEAITERKRIEERFRLIHKNFAYVFEGAF